MENQSTIINIDSRLHARQHCRDITRRMGELAAEMRALQADLALRNRGNRHAASNVIPFPRRVVMTGEAA